MIKIYDANHELGLVFVDEGTALRDVKQFAQGKGNGKM